MKRILFFTIIMFVLTFTINAQNDTMYIMKSGTIVGKYNVNTEVDSVIFYKPTIAEPTSGTFTDTRDGNIYHWVKIGNQVWMVENLRYLPSVVGPATGSTTTPYYYVYGYDGTDINAAKATSNYTTYGVLYNWPAAIAGPAGSSTNPSGVQGVCPAGWHLPSDAEWTQLTDYLGGESVASYKLKEIGTTHWQSPNTGATNETGFTALPCGYRYTYGIFSGIGILGFWWSATEGDSNTAWSRFIDYYNSSVGKNYYHNDVGYSVRCVRN